MAELNFSSILKRLGDAMVKELAQNIYRQRDLDNRPFAPRKKQKKNEPTTRLWVTGKFVRNAFKFRVTPPNGLRLELNNAGWGKGKSYNDIGFYNNEPTSDNPKSPLIFPKTDKDAKKMVCVQEFEQQLTKDTLDYFKSIGVNVPTKLKFG